MLSPGRIGLSRMVATSLKGLGAWSNARSLVSSLETSRRLLTAQVAFYVAGAAIHNVLVSDHVSARADDEAGTSLFKSLGRCRRSRARLIWRRRSGRLCRWL